MTIWLRRVASVLLMHAVGLVIACKTGDWAWALVPVPLFGTVPSSLTDEYDAVLTTTLRAMQPRIRDNITRGNKYLAFMESKGRIRKQNGGERVQVGLRYGLNGAADIYSGYGNLDTTPQDGITSAFFEWTQMAVPVSISRREERQNSGQSRLISLLREKESQAEDSLKELVNNCLVAGRIASSAALGQFFARRGRLDSNAQGPLPLAALIDANPARSVAIGNINGNTYTWWRNQATSSVATTFNGLKLELNTVYNNCSKGTMGNPDLMLGDQVAWETYWGALQTNERYLIDDKRTIDILGGTDALKFRGAVFTWDEVVPDVETNAEVVDGVGTPGTSNVHFLNSQAAEVVVDSETDFITTPFVRPVGQDARVAEILWMGASCIANRRKLGVLYGISRTITA
jgi:hypothetical protein